MTKRELQFVKVARQLITYGMPPELAGPALNSWATLLDATEPLLLYLEGQIEAHENKKGKKIDAGFWIQWAFMQGFVAGTLHRNEGN